MKNLLFTLITFMVFGTTVCFGRTNKNVERDVEPRQHIEMRHHDKMPEPPKEPKHFKKSFRDQRRHNDVKPPIKKNEVTVSIQTLHFGF